MSISTRTGDEGTTALMYGRRVSKNHFAVETYGTVDELNSALGMARATSPDAWVQTHLLGIQRNLVALMGQLAVAPEDTERYASSKYPKLTPEMLAVLDHLVMELESQKITFEGWATPGDTVAAAALDVARTVCRRAERLVIAGYGQGADGSAKEPVSDHIRLIIQYLNRLSDVLWLLARFTETRYPHTGIARKD
ncbi:MAG: cob(I)yrinic acid a,c-diamide adenosyltransferase [Candidatus Methylacidiphilales bacterium]|nr:cob(I)yrinic acid a,c-diamide adenosyltransferase [Candidatus Methylacidiphilales bacterium]